MTVLSVMLRQKSLALAAVFVMIMLIGGMIGSVVQQICDDERRTREEEGKHKYIDLMRAKAGVLNYTDSMEQLPRLRPLFDFSLTPWAVQYDWNTDQSDPDIKWSMIVMVKSHSKNVWARNIARMTWAKLNYCNGVRMETIFIVGNAESPKAEYELLKENKLYGDLIQIDIEERYRDVVFKTLAGMQYAASHFPCDWIYVSADDDIVPNLTKIHEEVEQFIITKDDIVAESSGSCRGSSSLKILCGWHSETSAKTRRDLKDKWFMTLQEYPEELYAPYCKGPWYSMRILHATELYGLTRMYTAFWVDDVWITGTLRLKHIQNDEGHFPTELSSGLVNTLSVGVADNSSDRLQSWIFNYEYQLKENYSCPP